MATLLEQVKEAIEKFKTDDSVIKAKGASDNLVAYLVPDTYEVSDLRGKVLVYCPRAQAGNKYRIALQSTGPRKALGDKTLEVSCVILKDDMTLGNLESSGRTKVIISGSGDKKNKDFKDSVDAIADALKIEKKKSASSANKFKAFNKGQTPGLVPKGDPVLHYDGKMLAREYLRGMHEELQRQSAVPGSKRRSGLPKFIKVNGNDVVAGYYEFKGVPNSLISDLPAKQRKYGNFARRAQRKMVSDEKIDITNSKFNSKSSQAWEEYNDAREQYNMAEDEATKKKWQKKMDKAEARAKDAGSPIGKSTVRLYVSKYAGNNGKHDLYLQIGNNLALPTKDNDGKILGVNKVSEFTHAKGKKNLVVAVVYPKASSRNSALTSNNMIVFGENKPLQTLVSEWREAEKDKSKTAFAERLGGENGLPYETYTALDSESNGDKYIENGSPIVKIGEALKYAKAGVIGAVLGGVVAATIITSLGGGQISDNINRSAIENAAREGSLAHIFNTLEISEETYGNDSNGIETASLPDTKGKTYANLFNYTSLNNESNVIIDTASESEIEKMFNSTTYASTFGYNYQTAIDNNTNYFARAAAGNIIEGMDYTAEAIRGSFEGLGAAAGQEIAEHGVSLAEGDIIYPNGTNNSSSFEELLRYKGLSRQLATEAVDAYSNAFAITYEENLNQIEAEVPEEDFDLNDSQGNLQETVNAITGDNILIVNVHYNDSKKNGVIYGINEEGNLKEISFENTTDIAVTSAEGLETALLSDPEPEIKEYASLGGLMFDDYTRNNIYNNLTDENGRIFYQITGVPTHDEEIEVETENENGSTTTSTTTVTINAHYDTVVVTLDKNFNVDKASVNVYSNSGKTESKEGIVKTAVSEITDGKVPGSPALYTLTSEEPETSSYPNQLSQENIEQAQEALREELSNENTNGTQIVPVSKERTR